MTMHFGKLMCIRCSQPGHLSHQCKKPILKPVAPVKPEKQEDVKAADDEQQLIDIYDEFLTGG
jgi:hypothetical protein